jgi:hypothetical protein
VLQTSSAGEGPNGVVRGGLFVEHPRMRLTVEETLTRVEHRLAMLRHLADNSGASEYDRPDAATWSGIADACADAQQWTRDVRQSLDCTALATELKRRSEA